MSHNEAKFEWHLEGKQDFTVRLSAEIPSGVIIDSILAIKLQKRTGTNPEVWADTGTTDESRSIVNDDFDADNPVTDAAVYWAADADVDGDPVPRGGPYRWIVIASLDNGLDVVKKTLVDLIP